MVRWLCLALAMAGMGWAGPVLAEGTTVVSGQIVDRGAGSEGVPVAILVRGADGDRRDLLVSKAGTFSLVGLRPQQYTFQAERPERVGATSIALSLPVTLSIYEGARYHIDFPYPKNGRLAAPHAVEQQAYDVHVIR